MRNIACGFFVGVSLVVQPLSADSFQPILLMAKISDLIEQIVHPEKSKMSSSDLLILWNECMEEIEKMEESDLPERIASGFEEMIEHLMHDPALHEALMRCIEQALIEYRVLHPEQKGTLPPVRGGASCP